MANGLNTSGGHYTNDTGAIFVQLDGVGPSDLLYLGCHDLGDMEEPFGDIERTYCPDPAQRGAWKVDTRMQGPGGEITFDIEFPIGPLSDYLEQAARNNCPLPIYAVFNQCTARYQFSPFERVQVAKAAVVTSSTRTAPSSRNADGGTPAVATKTMSFSAAAVFDAFGLTSTRRVTAEAEALLDIASCIGAQCAGNCGGANAACDELVAVAAAGAAAIAGTEYSLDEGVTWATAAADPFIADEDISSVVCFTLDDGTRRWLVARGTTDGANPHEVAYTDDAGATWTLVNVGATNAEFSPWNGCLFMWSPRAIWLATDTGAGAAGEIYFSTDFGATWVAQGAAAADALNALSFCSERIGIAVGDTNEILHTTDAGAHWATIAGPAAQAAVDALSCVCFSTTLWYVGYEDGEVWYTQDGGTAWVQVPLTIIPGFTNAAVNAIDAIDEHTLFLAMKVNDGADDWAAIYRTVSGGEQWEYWLAPLDCDSGDGLNSVVACHVNRAFGVGCPETTAMILEVAES